MPAAGYARYLAERTPPGEWTGTFACAALASAPPAAFPARIALEGDAVELLTGKPGEPGSLRLTGTRQPDGRLLLAGTGVSGLQDHRGKEFSASIRGRFQGERFQGRGKLGTRDCALTIARR